MAWFLSTGGESSGPTKAIASTNQQYINLPVYDDDNPIIECKLLVTANSPQAIIIGELWDLAAFCLYMESDNNLYFRYNTNYEHLYTIPQNRWNWMNVRIYYGTGIVTVDGVDYTPAVAKTQLHNQIKLFGIDGHEASVALKDVKIYKNNSLFMDLEARKDDVTGAGYFYDKVGQQDYYSNTANPLIYTEI